MSVKAYLVANKFHCAERGKQIAGKVFLMENRSINSQFKIYLQNIYMYMSIETKYFGFQKKTGFAIDLETWKEI